MYLSSEFVETETDFMRLKAWMARIGDVMPFENFVVRIPDSIDVSSYNTVIVWCESFDQFITAAKVSIGVNHAAFVKHAGLRHYLSAGTHAGRGVPPV